MEYIVTIVGGNYLLQDIFMTVVNITPIQVRSHKPHGYEPVSSVVAILIAIGNNAQSGKKAQIEI